MASSNNEPHPPVAQLVQTSGIIVTASITLAAIKVRTADNTAVADVPKLDLESYALNYRGRALLNRLLLIASTSTVLAVDALKLAGDQAWAHGKDVLLYQAICEEMRSLAPAEREIIVDKKWVERTSKNNKAELHRLEGELKGYKNNLIKESIRMGNEDLAKHLESMGELQPAYETYAKMRADVSSTKQIVECGLHLARISVFRREWSMVIANVNKISGLQPDKDKDGNDKSLQALCNILYGIGLLGQSKYVEAAASFLQVEPLADASWYEDFASPNDIATYGGLLALATMSRLELTKFLETSSFRTFLELEPHLRRAISQFVNGRYSACLAILESYRPDYLLDIYLQPHVKHLYTLIRGKCIFHFLQPFSCVTIDSMNAAFAPAGGSIEAELEDMIRNGGLEARIDAIDKVVTTTTTNPRARMQAASLAAAKNYEKDALDRIRRIGIISAELEVKGKPKGHMHHQADVPMGSRWGSGHGEGNLNDYNDLAQGYSYA